MNEEKILQKLEDIHSLIIEECNLIYDFNENLKIIIGWITTTEFNKNIEGKNEKENDSKESSEEEGSCEENSLYKS